MKRIYNIGLVICLGAVLALFFSGCGLNQNVSVPEDCGGSLIYRLIPNPQQTGVFLRMGNLVLIDKGVYTAAQAVEAIEKIREKLDEPSITYAILSAYVDKEISPYFVLIGELVLQFSAFDIPIDECDIKLLKKHLVEQEAIAKLRM